MQLSVDDIEQAVQQFYQDVGSQAEIHTWLTEVQVSPEAWTFAWQLMDSQKGTEVQFFGASCLYMKLSKYWNECPVEKRDELRTHLFEYIMKFAGGPRIVLTRLCSSLSFFAFNTMPDEWPDAVQNIVQSFQSVQNINADQLKLILLELLKVLPEEFCTSHLGSYRQSIVKYELKKGVPFVLSLVNDCLLSGGNSEICSQALHCLTSWVQLGIPISETECFVSHVFHMLNDVGLFDVAIDTLVSIFSHPENYRHPQAMKRILPHILTLHPMLQEAIQESDMDKCQSLCRLIVLATDSNTELLIQFISETDAEKQLSLSLISLVLECTSIPGYFPIDETCSDLAFGFWYSLQDSVCSGPNESLALIKPTFVRIYMSLVDILLKKVQYPSEVQLNSWSNDEKEQHRCYRQDIADTLMYAYSLLGENVLHYFCQLIENYCTQQATEQVTWQDIEAVLFAITSISECIDLDELSYLPTVLLSLVKLPHTHVYITTQSLYLIAAFADWISSHPDVLEHVLPIILQALKHPSLAMPATMALKEIVRENQAHIQPYVNVILTTIQDLLQGNTLESREVTRLMACLGYVLSTVPVEQCMQYLNIILPPHMNQLQALGATQPTVTSRNEVVLKLSMLSWLFGSLNTNWQREEDTELSNNPSTPQPSPKEPQPVLLILQQVLPILSSLLHNWMSVFDVVDHICNLLQKALRTLMDEFSLLSTDLAQLLLQMYNAVPHWCILPVAKQLLLLCASNTTFQDTSNGLFHGICTKSLDIFQQGAREYPDVVEGFMSFLYQIVKKNKTLFNHETCNIPGLLGAAIVSLSMAESHPVKASALFLCEFIQYGTHNAQIKEAVCSFGAAIVEQIMNSLGGASPRSLVEPIADVLFALNKCHTTELAAWMKVILERPDFPNANASLQSKQQFMSRVLKEKGNKRRVREAAQEYTLLWRGMIGTEYAAQTSRPAI